MKDSKQDFELKKDKGMTKEEHNEWHRQQGKSE